MKSPVFLMSRMQNIFRFLRSKGYCSVAMSEDFFLVVPLFIDVVAHQQWTLAVEDKSLMIVP